MKKAGILTLNGEFNYGNRLQAYALQRAIAEIGASPETIMYTPLAWSAKRTVKYAIGRLPLLHPRLAYWRMLTEKEKVFAPFSNECIRTRRVNSNMTGISDDYDMFIAGSDQVWNPERVKGSSTNLLGFAPAQKRTSYAASFGVSEIPDEQRKRYAKNLSNFSKMSVREEDGKRIVEELTGRKDVAIVPDPTMLLTRDDWDGLAGDTKPRGAPTRKYIVIYALHELTDKNEAKIHEYARANSCEVYQIMGDLYDKTHKIPDPREFVRLVAHAEAVFTDSFHCCVFSIIYHRPFIVFDRTDGQKMSSRLATLVQKFGLTQAMVDDAAELGLVLESEDFKDTDKILSNYREVGIRFLTEILRGE